MTFILRQIANIVLSFALLVVLFGAEAVAKGALTLVACVVLYHCFITPLYVLWSKTSEDMQPFMEKIGFSREGHSLFRVKSRLLAMLAAGIVLALLLGPTLLLQLCIGGLAALVIWSVYEDVLGYLSASFGDVEWEDQDEDEDEERDGSDIANFSQFDRRPH